jgi:hypothetical protein
VGSGEVSTHADGLGPLAGEKEGDFFAHGIVGSRRAPLLVAHLRHGHCPKNPFAGKARGSSRATDVEREAGPDVDSTSCGG